MLLLYPQHPVLLLKFKVNSSEILCDSTDDKAKEDSPICPLNVHAFDDAVEADYS